MRFIYYHSNMHEILLYYKYTKIADPKQLMRDQTALCKALDLKGRILISHEGINGTLGGLPENTQKYIDAMKADARFQDVHWKRSTGPTDAFPRLSVRVREEIVTGRLSTHEVDPNQITGKRLTPDELHKWFKEKKDFVIIDMRNSYEYRFGHFRNSIDPGMENFYDLPKKIAKLKKKYKDKTVLTVCTGGVRCEKASGVLVKNGFGDVYQLDGGMVSYMEKYPAENYDGSLFVFDKRQNVYFESPEKHVVISHCDFCNAKSEIMRNCCDSFCNGRMVSCEKCMPTDRCRECPKCAKLPAFFKSLRRVYKRILQWWKTVVIKNT